MSDIETKPIEEGSRAMAYGPRCGVAGCVCDATLKPGLRVWQKRDFKSGADPEKAATLFPGFGVCASHKDYITVDKLVPSAKAWDNIIRAFRQQGYASPYRKSLQVVFVPIGAAEANVH